MLKLFRPFAIVIFVFCLSVYASAARAVDKTESRCEILNEQAQQELFKPPRAGLITGRGRVHFHSAPDHGCGDKLFIVPGDRVTIYNPYKDWLYVMYINSKTGEDYMAWIARERVQMDHIAGTN